MSRFLNQSFDDRDTNHLKYEGTWVFGGSYNASNVGETGTLASTKDLNATITFAFPVPAIAFYYYGIPRCCGGLYGICIDCDPLNPNFIPIDAVNRTDDGKNPPIVLYSRRFDIPGIHEIIIRNENDTSVIPSGNSQLTIDRIDLEVVDTSVISSTTPSPTVTSIPLAGSSSSSALNSSSSPIQSSSSHSPPIGAIVGGVLAGGFVLTLVLLFLFWFRLKQRRKASENLSPSSFATSPQQTSSLQPPLLSSISTTLTPPTQNSATSPSANAQYPGRYGYAPRPGKGAQSHIPSPLPSDVSSGSTSQPSSSQAQVRREQDAGPLPADLGEPTLPPDYNQVFSHTIHSSNIPPG